MSTLQYLFLAFLFISVAGIGYGLSALVLRRPVAVAATPSDPAQGEAWLVRVAAMSAPLARLAIPSEGWDSSALRIRFLHAGLRQNFWPTLFFAAKTGFAIGLPTLFLFGASVTNQPWLAELVNKQGSKPLLFAVLLLATAGYYLPNLLLRIRTQQYQRELFEAFPDAIDMIIVCIEAGLGLDAAIARTAEELRLRSPELADELHLVGLELRVGASRTMALRNLALRTGLDEATSLVNMLLQADRFGSSIANSLRVHADGQRTHRRQLAEEAAAKIPLKLLFPLIFCIFPSLMLVLVGPAAINIYRVFLKNIAGQ